MAEQNMRVGIFLIYNGALFSFDQVQMIGKPIDKLEKSLSDFGKELIKARDIPADTRLDLLPRGEVSIENGVPHLNIDRRCIVYLSQIYEHFNMQNASLVEISLME